MRRRSSGRGRCSKRWARAIIATGPIGSGHAVKALNNYVSAAGLAAACEAAIIAEKFGVDPDVLVDVLNVSTGRNNSTELKMKPFVLSGSFASGFAMALMAKDLRTAADLAEQLGVDAEGARRCGRVVGRGLAAQGKGADHTEIYRFLAARSQASEAEEQGHGTHHPRPHPPRWGRSPSPRRARIRSSG